MAKSVKIKVDLENREKLRRLHTATHIINFSVREILGNHVWQNGSNLKAEFGTLDITHYDNLTQDQIFKIERLANQTVFDNKTVTIEELERTQAEKKYGYTLYQGGAIPMKKLRIIKVMDSDIEACGGIHMEKTGGIGLIKITDAQKIQDGVVRLKYVVNQFALEQVESYQNILTQTAQILSVNPKDVPKTSQKFFEDWKKQKKQIEDLQKEIKQIHINNIKSSKNHEFKLSNLDMGMLIEIFTNAMQSKKKLLIGTDQFAIATNDIKVAKSKKQLPKGKFTVYIK